MVFIALNDVEDNFAILKSILSDCGLIKHLVAEFEGYSLVCFLFKCRSDCRRAEPMLRELVLLGA